MKTKYRYYGQCPFCLAIEGPYDTVTGMTKDVQSLHSQCSPTLVPSTGAPAVSSPFAKKPLSSYVRGDSSRPFGSGFDGTCYHCGIGYNIGDFICMVTYVDGAKGKAVHEECTKAALERLNSEDQPDQSFEPPF